VVGQLKVLGTSLWLNKSQNLFRLGGKGEFPPSRNQSPAMLIANYSLLQSPSISFRNPGIIRLLLFVFWVIVVLVVVVVFSLYLL
jgi:hypothetical protein